MTPGCDATTEVLLERQIHDRERLRERHAAGREIGGLDLLRDRAIDVLRGQEGNAVFPDAKEQTVERERAERLLAQRRVARRGERPDDGAPRFAHRFGEGAPPQRCREVACGFGGRFGPGDGLAEDVEHTRAPRASGQVTRALEPRREWREVGLRRLLTARQRREQRVDPFLGVSPALRAERGETKGRLLERCRRRVAVHQANGERGLCCERPQVALGRGEQLAGDRDRRSLAREPAFEGAAIEHATCTKRVHDGDRIGHSGLIDEMRAFGEAHQARVEARHELDAALQRLPAPVTARVTAPVRVLLEQGFPRHEEVRR